MVKVITINVIQNTEKYRHFPNTTWVLPPKRIKKTDGNGRTSKAINPQMEII